MFFAVLFCGSITIAQSTSVEVSATVVDEQGNPISGVDVFGSKGTQSSTDDKGQFKITLSGEGSLVIQKRGYESQIISAGSISDNITLIKSTFLTSEDDEILMGVSTRNNRDIVGAVSSVNPGDRLTYDNTQFVRSYIAGLTVGVRGSDNIRGIGNALFVIDGVFGRNPSLLNMEEVEQIKVLKDANAIALYGSQGINGVIVINTKRGKINKKEINVNVNSGIAFPIALPNYLDAASAMVLRDEARINDGLSPDDSSLFRNDVTNPILNTRNGVNPIQFPDVDLYDFVQPSVNRTNVITEFSGGNEKSQFYVNAGWTYQEDWVDINDDINAGLNRFNVRGNIDFKVNDWITSSIDAVYMVQTNRGPRANIFQAATTFIPFDYAPLIPLSSIDTSNDEAFQELVAGASVFNGNLLGTAQQFGVNAPVALAIAGGYNDNTIRATQFNNTVNFDLSAITEGLTAKTYLSFDFIDSYTTSIRNEFRTFTPTTFTENNVTGLDSFGRDLRSLSETVNSNGFLSRLGFYGLINYEKTFAKDHSINTTVLTYFNSQDRAGAIQTDKDAHLGFQMTYDFKKKLYIDFSGAYIHSLKLPEGNRGALSPTLGLGYILSEEDFLKNNNVVNYLKLKASGGVIKSDRGINGYYLYDENYTSRGTFAWSDGLQSNRRQEISQGANLNLDFEERIDLNLGVEAYLMNSLWIEANFFRTEIGNQITRLADQYPSYYGDFRPFNNFDEDLYTGFEMGINYNKTFKDFTIAVGANILYNKAEALRRSETNEFAYQNRQGREIQTTFGLESLGFYQEGDFTPDANGNLILNSNLPVPNFGDVQPGDLKYADQNNDGIIDQDDNIALGQRNPNLNYGVNLRLKYKDFSFFVLGSGIQGAIGNKLGFNNYYSPNGNEKYSEVVLGRWTPETASTATFPRLSATNNQNNFRTSSFWLFDNSFFLINRAQLTYELTDSLCDKIGVKNLSVNLQGTNLFEIAKNLDISQLNIGGAPQARTFTAGVRLSL